MAAMTGNNVTLADQVAAIVRANRGKVDYRAMCLLTMRPRAELVAIVRNLRAAGRIPR